MTGRAFQARTTLSTPLLLKNGPWTSPEAHGAAADGTTDDTTAINTAAAYARDNGLILRFSPGKTYKISATVTFESNVDGRGATITTADATLAPAVQFGVTGAQTNSRSRLVIFPRILTTGKTLAGWSAGGIGLKILNALECEFHLQLVRYFETGLLLSADGALGNVYNTFHMGHLENNKVNLHILPAVTTAWVNQNTFIGGRWSHNSALEGTGVAGTRHLLIQAADTTGDHPNENVFFNPSMENNVAEYHIEFRGGHRNVIYQPRLEATTPKIYFNQTSATVYATLNRIYMEASYLGYTVAVTESANATANQVETERYRVYDANVGTSGLLRMRSISADTDPLLLGLPPAISPYAGSTSTAFTLAIAAAISKYKATGDSDPRFQLAHSTGILSWGPGNGAVDITLQRIAGPAFSFSHAIVCGGFFRTNSGIHNNNDFNNSTIKTGTTGVEIERNVNDANPTLKVEQQHASSTGDIIQALNSTTNVVAKVTRAGAILGVAPTAGVGYGTGAGGTVTQLVSKATGVQIDKVCGQITMHNATLAAGAEVSFVVTCAAVVGTDVVIVNHASGGTAGAYLVDVAAVGAGSFRITVSNASAGDLGEAIVLNFAVIKGVTA